MHTFAYSPRGLFQWPYVVALVVLVANDHAFKGSGMLPGWLTGKLSDVAGLFLAPAVLAATLRLRDRRAVWLGALAIAVVFTALETSTAFVRVWETASELVGVPWRVTMDLTDLLTLPMLVPGVLCFVLDGGAPKLRERALLVLCLCASAASSPPNDFQSTRTSRGPLLVNSGAEDLVFRLQVLRQDLGVRCDGVLEDPAHSLPQSAFSIVQRFRLEPGGMLQLESLNARCSLVLFTLDGRTPRLVAWDPLGFPARELPWVLDEEQLEQSRNDERFVHLEVTAGVPEYHSAGQLLFDFEPNYDVSAECALPAPASESWTDFPAYDAPLVVTERLSQPDGCMRVGLRREAPLALAPSPEATSMSGPPSVDDEDLGSSDAGASDADASDADASDADASDADASDADASDADASDADASDADAGLEFGPIALRGQGEDPSVNVWVCVPPAAFPFAVGETIIAEANGDVLSVESTEREAKLEVFRNAALPASRFPIEFHAAASNGCGYAVEESPASTARLARVDVLTPWGREMLRVDEHHWFRSDERSVLVGVTDARERILGTTAGSVLSGYSLMLGSPASVSEVEPGLDTVSAGDR